MLKHLHILFVHYNKIKYSISIQKFNKCKKDTEYIDKGFDTKLGRNVMTEVHEVDLNSFRHQIITYGSAM